MEIFYLKKSEILKVISRESLEKFSDGRVYSNEDKYLEHLLGRFLTKFVAKNFYDKENTNIVLKNSKPVFETGNLFFSISHSKDIVLVAFNNKNIGVDIEFLCERKNYKDIMERFGKAVHNPSRIDFYKFWTLHEAEIKLAAEIKSLFTAFIEKDYIVSCVSSDVLISAFCLKKLICSGEDVNLQEEYLMPKNCKFLSSVE